jgi:hypothetical protein
MILTRLAFTSLVFSLACVVTAQAHDLLCLPRAEALGVLQVQLDQHPLLSGRATSGEPMELFFSQVTENWTIAITLPAADGGLTTCRLLAGFKLRPGAVDLGPVQ